MKLILFVTFLLITAVALAVIDHVIGYQSKGSKMAKVTHLAVAELIGCGIWAFILWIFGW